MILFTTTIVYRAHYSNRIVSDCTIQPLGYLCDENVYIEVSMFTINLDTFVNSLADWIEPLCKHFLRCNPAGQASST